MEKNVKRNRSEPSFVGRLLAQSVVLGTGSLSWNKISEAVGYGSSPYWISNENGDIYMPVPDRTARNAQDRPLSEFSAGKDGDSKSIPAAVLFRLPAE
jgi:hypothetical protein